MRSYNKHLPAMAIITLLVTVISISCIPEPCDETEFEYEILYVEGMPCIWGETTDTVYRAGLSCDWSQWEGN